MMFRIKCIIFITKLLSFLVKGIKLGKKAADFLFSFQLVKLGNDTTIHSSLELINKC